jgi:hypothetical protein
MDFNPILDTEPENKNRLQKAEEAQLDKEALSLTNLLNITNSHIKDDETCRSEIKEATDILDANKDKMSIKELLEFVKIKIREREFHTNCIYKAYNFILKTEMAKQLLLGTNKEEKIVNITDRARIDSLSKLLKNSM